MAVGKKGIEEMMNELQEKPELSKTSLMQSQNKVNAFENWVRAVENGTFHGKESIHVAGLLNLLHGERKIAIEEFESIKLSEMKSPEWGVKPSDKNEPAKTEATA